LPGCHGVLRFHRLPTLDAYRKATPEQLACLHTYRGDIRRLVDAGNPDVMLALFPPIGISWSVSRLAFDPYPRHPTVISGTVGETHDTLVDVRDANAERRAWWDLVGVLATGHAPLRLTGL
jgi:hypothetical protein